MLQNAYFLAKIGVDTAENERNSAEILPKIGNYPAGPPPMGLPPMGGMPPPPGRSQDSENLSTFIFSRIGLGMSGEYILSNKKMEWKQKQTFGKYLVPHVW